MVITAAFAQERAASANISFGQGAGTLDIQRISLGQGGLSPDPMWEDRVTEIQALHPRLIRLFIQEYFNLLTTSGYNFGDLDRSVDLILQTDAKPLMNISFKPRILFPQINQDIVEPNDWNAWEDLVSALVRHYKDRGAGALYWEVANEPDIGESGGTPYRFTPDNYLPFYQHTAAAVLRADPDARVGGPAVASAGSPILLALINFGAAGRAPVHFVSWHIYSSEPASVRGTVEYIKGLLAQQPDFKPETILDEWNMSLSDPVLDPRFQPAYVAETAYQMLDAGLDHSCYYHIRDYSVNVDTFAEFMSSDGANFMGNWWNSMPQFDGLFDHQNTVRPAYFAFKLLSRIGSDRLQFQSSDPALHGFFAYDPVHMTYNLMLWNFSAMPVNVAVSAADVPERLLISSELLNAYDENAPLYLLDPITTDPGNLQMQITLDAWGVAFWSFQRGPGISSAGTIFTTPITSLFTNDSAYELGTRFYADVNGQITAVRLYTNALEGGNHTVSIWQGDSPTPIAGPYTWNISSGTAGWKIFMLPTPLSIAANTEYIVAISNRSDKYYAYQHQGFAAPIVNGHLHTYVDSGVYTTTLGTRPTAVWQYTNYFRDVVFVPQ